MRIALVHDTLNKWGGGEEFVLALAKTLKELGHNVDLYVIEKTDWNRVKKYTSYGRLEVDNEYVLPFFKMLPTIYARMVHWLGRDIMGIHIIRNRKYDLIIATKQIMVPIFADIVYMHFPSFIPGFMYLYHPEKYLYNKFLRAYSKPLELIAETLIALFKSLDYKPLILTNSRFSASIIERFLDVKALVLYPPINVEKYLPLSQNKSREDLVVTISRISPEKNLSIVLEVAREVKNVKFVILGSIGLQSYYLSLLKMLKTSKLEDRVKIVTNAPENVKMEILKRAKIYLHPMKYEHFGIAIVEAMASGLVPIVHRSGGPWTDIVEFGKYGLGFDHVEDLTNKLHYLLTDQDCWKELASKVAEKVHQFSQRYFKLKLATILSIFYKYKYS